MPQQCINDNDAYLRQRMWVTNGMYNTAFLKRGSSSHEAQTHCQRGCGQGIFDNSIPQAVMRDVMAVMATNFAGIQKAATVSKADAYNPDDPISLISGKIYV